MRKIAAPLRRRPRMPSLELVLRLEDGSPWSLTVSAGIERFIGHYPRIDGFDAGAPVLNFEAVDPA
jgi:hypothetical protein